VIIDWGGNVYLDGPRRAFAGPELLAPPAAAASVLLYNLWSPVRVEYGDTFVQAGDSAAYGLLYNLWSPVRAEYGGTPAISSIWQAEGQGACIFEAGGEIQLWWRCDGDAVTTWFLYEEPLSGFHSDGSSTCEFLGVVASTGGFVAQGNSTASFIAGEPSQVYGFRSDGTSTCVFLASPGTGAECLTPPDPEPGPEPGAAAIPNYAL
jgi:hypothetical protein